jgi:predicted dienelactone hydrolase
MTLVEHSMDRISWPLFCTVAVALSPAVFYPGSMLAADQKPKYDPLEVSKDNLPAPLDLTVKDTARSREIPVRIYLPPNKLAAPVVLFSHGLGGSRENSPYLGTHWQARGYVAVFMQHPGSDESVWRGKPFAGRLPAMRDAASLDNFVLRVKDVPAVIDQLEQWNKADGNELKARLDMEHIGMCGHSFGATTTQAVSGQRFPVTGTSLTDKRIKAAIAFSPSSPRNFDVNKAFGEVSIPWMLMTGTQDVAPIGDQDVKSRLAVFPALPPGDKYEVVLKDAQHSAFGDRPLPGEKLQRNPNHHRVILALSTAFWDTYLRNDVSAKTWLSGDGPKSVMESADVWEKK